MWLTVCIRKHKSRVRFATSWCQKRENKHHHSSVCLNTGMDVTTFEEKDFYLQKSEQLLLGQL